MPIKSANLGSNAPARSCMIALNASFASCSVNPCSARILLWASVKLFAGVVSAGGVPVSGVPPPAGGVPVPG